MRKGEGEIERKGECEGRRKRKNNKLKCVMKIFEKSIPSQKLLNSIYPSCKPYMKGRE